MVVNSSVWWRGGGEELEENKDVCDERRLEEGV